MIVKNKKDINKFSNMRICIFGLLNAHYPPLICLFLSLKLKPLIIIKYDPKPIIMLKMLRKNGNNLKPRNIVSSKRKVPKIK
jgi:hypothetical protein